MIVITVELIGMGVFLAYFVGLIYSTGGVMTIDMTHFGEQHIEYILMLIMTATTPYALYFILEEN